VTTEPRLAHAANAARHRIDRWLWCARFYRSRALAAAAVGGGKVHVNGERAKPARNVLIGDRLDIILGTEMWTVVVRALPSRRGPASEAQACYEESADSILRRAVDAGTRAILLCHPHNPTGRVLRRAELEGIAALALERDLVVVSDELHGDLVLPGAEHVPFASLGPEVEARTITLTAASKAFNIAGLRCAVAVFGSDSLRRRFLELPRHLRGGLGILGIEATRAAWRFADPWREAVVAKLAENRRLVAERVAEALPGVRFHPPEATYFAWLDCRALGLEPSPFRFFLDRARVAFSDGASFGRPGAGFVRLNFATSRALVTEAIERAAKALKEV